MTIIGGDQFLRTCTVKAFDKLGIGRTYSGLRVRFNITKTSESAPNTSKIQIMNLNPDSRSFLEGEDMKIQVEAGYKGVNQVISTGDITKAISEQQHPDWVTRVESGDGLRALKENHLDISFANGTPYQAIFAQGLKALGVTTGPSLFAIPDIAIGGFSFSGTAKELLDKLASRFNIEWSVQNGAVEVSTSGVPLPGLAIVISGTAGLIGNVKKRDKSIEFQNLLNGEIIPGRVLSVLTDEVKGFYKTKKVIYDGDTHDGPWYANVEAEQL